MDPKTKRRMVPAYGSRETRTTKDHVPTSPRDDTMPLFVPGSIVEVALDAGAGRTERWIGLIVRGASGERRSVELQPAGCSTSIEFALEEVRSCVRCAAPSPMIERLQAMRVGRR